MTNNISSIKISTFNKIFKSFPTKSYEGKKMIFFTFSNVKKKYIYYILINVFEVSIDKINTLVIKRVKNIRVKNKILKKYHIFKKVIVTFESVMDVEYIVSRFRKIGNDFNV